MTIIDEFFLKFSSNAKDVTKDVAAAQKATDNFEQEIKKTDKATADLGLSFSKLALAGVAAIESFAALGKLKDSVLGVIDYNAEIEKTARLTNINARELSLWNDVVARAGGNPGGKEYLAFITALNDKYAGLGINERTKRVNEDLLKTADILHEMELRSKGSSQSFAQLNGIGHDLWLTLKDGRAAVLASMDAMGRLDTTTEKSTKSSFELKQQWVEISIAARSWADALTPLANVLSTIVGWIVKGAAIGQNSLTRILMGESWADALSTGGRSTSANAGTASSGALGASKALPLISQYESSNRNVLNASGPGGTAASTASGYYQITNGTWRDFAPRAGVSLNQYPTAMSAPLDVQTRVASLLYQQRGLEPWSSDTRLLAAVGQNGIAQADSTTLPSSSVSNQKSLSVGSVTINTQSTTPQAIAGDFHQELSNTFAAANTGDAF